MFVTLIGENDNRVSGTVLFYSDPSSLLLKQEVMSPGALVAKAFEMFVKSGSLPAFTFVSAFEEDKPPKVITGYLQYIDDQFRFLVPSGKSMNLEFEFEKKNKVVLSLPNDVFPVVNKKEAANKVEFHHLRTFRNSLEGKSLVKSWIGALTVLLIKSTQFLMCMLKNGRKEMGYITEQLTAPSSRHKESGCYWLYWSCSKPRSLEEWIRGYWDQTVSCSVLQEIHNELHPYRSGFYRIQLSEEQVDEDGRKSVDLVWMVQDNWVQYRVDVIEGEDGTRDQFGGNSSDRAKLCVQNKMRAVYPGEGKGKDRKSLDGCFWDFIDEVSSNRAFIVRELGFPPCPYTRALSGSSETAIENWKKLRFGPGTPLSGKLELMLSNDAIITEQYNVQSVVASLNRSEIPRKSG